MASNQEQIIKADLYLAGAMTEAEKRIFEHELAQNPELAETLALLRSMEQSLGNPNRRRLLDALTDVVKEDTSRPQGNLNGSWKKRFAFIALALIAILTVWFYLRHEVQTPSSAPSQSPYPAQPPVRDSVPGLAPPTKEDTNLKPRPIAALDPASFTPNPALDPLAGVHVRGTGSALQITKPVTNEILPLTDGNINFKLRGSAGDETALYLRIYNNLETDFIAGKPVFQTDIAVSDFRFTFDKTLKLKPGRYYAAIYQPGEEEALTIQRFYVKPR